MIYGKRANAASFDHYAIFSNKIDIEDGDTMSNNFTSGMAAPAAVGAAERAVGPRDRTDRGATAPPAWPSAPAKTLTIEASKQFAWARPRASPTTATSTKWMQAWSAYNASTGSLSISVDTISGSGTLRAVGRWRLLVR